MFNPTRAAVSLTYDDGMSQHLDHAVPDLESHGLRGTFYVPTGGGPESPWHARAAEWVATANRGHEVGNHTHFHPCRGSANRNLSEYTLDQITSEVALSEQELAARVGVRPRSFAYPCCNTTVGPDSNQTSYVEFVNTLFPASRVAGDQSADPAKVDFGLIPSFIMRETVAVARAIELLDQAIADGHWLVFTFHGVGGGHINFGRPEHRALCEAISERSRDLKCGTFVEIATLIRTVTHRPWVKSQKIS